MVIGVHVCLKWWILAHTCISSHIAVKRPNRQPFHWFGRGSMAFLLMSWLSPITVGCACVSHIWIWVDTCSVSYIAARRLIEQSFQQLGWGSTDIPLHAEVITNHLSLNHTNLLSYQKVTEKHEPPLLSFLEEGRRPIFFQLWLKTYYMSFTNLQLKIIGLHTTSTPSISLIFWQETITVSSGNTQSRFVRVRPT